MFLLLLLEDPTLYYKCCFVFSNEVTPRNAMCYYQFIILAWKFWWKTCTINHVSLTDAILLAFVCAKAASCFYEFHVNLEFELKGFFVYYDYSIFHKYYWMLFSFLWFLYWEFAKNGSIWSRSISWFSKASAGWS